MKHANQKSERLVKQLAGHLSIAAALAAQLALLATTPGTFAQAAPARAQGGCPRRPRASLPGTGIAIRPKKNEAPFTCRKKAAGKNSVEVLGAGLGTRAGRGPTGQRAQGARKKIAAKKSSRKSGSRVSGRKAA